MFRSEDGGKTWKKTLFVSDNTGAVDRRRSDRFQHRVRIGLAGALQAVAELFHAGYRVESGIFKSIDGGKNWTRLVGHGWPEGKLRASLAATHTTQGTRVYAVIDAEGRRGLYRSDDAGANWKLVNDDGELVSS